MTRLEKRRAKNARHRANTKRKMLGRSCGALWSWAIEAMFAKRRKRSR